MTETLVTQLQALPMEARQRLVDKLPIMTEDEKRTLYLKVGESARERCTKDGWFWLQFVRTRDEADVETVKPFPTHLAYLKTLWEILTEQQRIAIAKSRQMMASWVLACFCVWTARFHPHQLVIWQTQTWPDATEKVSGAQGAKMGRCQFVEAHLPAWLQEPRLKINEGVMDYPNGSRIQALPGGADKVRGLTASVIVEDEFAYQGEARGVYIAVAPLIQKACKFIAVSTPNGSSNMFAEIWFGRAEITRARG